MRAIILGSGVSCREGEQPLETIPYTDIPSWPSGTIKGHKGVLDKYEDLWVLRGRAHIYQGYTWEQARFPTEYLADNGVTELVITNAAGGLNTNFEIGDLMQITGFIDLLKPGRARGNLDALKQEVQKFKTSSVCDLETYKNLSAEEQARIHQGTYIGVHGPSYETDSEVSLFRSLGADAVGMSTIPELEVAAERGMKVTVVSIITNVYGKTEELGHDGVVEVAQRASFQLERLLEL